MNTSIIVNIFISVISGILSAGLIFLAAQFLKKVIIPWYRGLKYKGLDISGQWIEKHNYRDVMLQESIITIYQNADKIYGEIMLAKKNKTTNVVFEAKSFKFKGDYNNNLLNITCWNSDSKQIGTHNYLVKAEMDGREMIGIKTYFDIGAPGSRANKQS